MKILIIWFRLCLLLSTFCFGACSSSGSAGELAFVVLVGILGFGLVVWMIEKNKSGGSRRLSARMTNERGIVLDKLLERKKGMRLGFKQRRLIAQNIGLYPWLPADLMEPWEERILVFLDQFPVTYAKTKKATDEMRLLVAAEACLLIVRRPLSDYRHLQVIHLWKDEIEGNEERPWNRNPVGGKPKLELPQKDDSQRPGRTQPHPARVRPLDRFCR